MYQARKLCICSYCRELIEILKCNDLITSMMVFNTWELKIYHGYWKLVKNLSYECYGLFTPDLFCELSWEKRLGEFKLSLCTFVSKWWVTSSFVSWVWV